MFTRTRPLSAYRMICISPAGVLVPDAFPLYKFIKMSLDETIAALADPTRREILGRLGRAPHRAGQLAAGFLISRPAIYNHTRLLRRAGLIRATKSGRQRIYDWHLQAGRRSTS
jgi:hypothetical protein